MDEKETWPLILRTGNETMEGDKLITYWDDCGNCGEKCSRDSSFYCLARVKPWCAVVPSARFLLYLLGCCSSSSSTSESHHNLLCFHSISTSYVFSEALHDLLLLTASVFDYHPALIPKTRCRVRGRCTATLMLAGNIKHSHRHG